MYSVEQHHLLGQMYAHAYGQGLEETSQAINPIDVPPEVIQPGKNYLKVQYILKNHVEHSEMKEMFKDFIVYSDMEIACAEVIAIIEKVPPTEKEIIITMMVGFLLGTNSNLIPLDRLITKIFFTLYERGVMPILPIAYGLIKSLDMKFRIPIDPKKVAFVREHLHEIGYKGMRDLLKVALIDKLGSLPRAITEFQRLQLVPVEDLMLDLLNRNRNLCPSLFVITEISRIHHSLRNVYILPRFSLAIRNFVASFRPVAEVGSILCRVWLYPVTSALTYSWFGNTWRFFFEGHSRIPVKTHLPYNTEFLSAQTYFEYMILKQPKGHFNMQYMLKAPSKTPYQCNELMQVIVLEAMKFTENTTLPVRSEVIQYNWRHVSHLVCYALCTNHGSFVTLLDYIKCHLDLLKFKRSRDELMWMILQYVSIPQRVEHKDGDRRSKSNQISIIFEIFNHLYLDELSWTGSSSETWEMARFFTPASIWINLAINNKDEETQPPEKIMPHVQYLENAINSKDMTSDGMLVVMANSYSNNENVFNTEICHPIYKRLHSSAGHQTSYLLPYGLQADGALECLDSQFLEALTFHAKQQLCMHLLFNVGQVMQNGKCPSPAIVETISRIVLKGEAVNSHGRALTVYLLNKMKPKEKTERSELYTMILYDIMTYRQKNAYLSPNNRCLLISFAFDLMPATGLVVGEKLPLYVLMEQTIIRQFMVAPPYDLLPMVALFAARHLKQDQTPSTQKFNMFMPPINFFKKTNEQSLCPEIGKLLMLYFIIGYKFTADYPSEGSMTDFINAMNDSYKWPKCSLRWFPKNISGVAQADSMPDTQLLNQYEELIEAEQNALWHSNEATYLPNRPPVTFITILNSLIKYPNMAFPPTTHGFLNTMSIVNLTANINALVIYMILKARRVNAESEYEQMIRCLYKMIFVERYLPFERFFLSLVLHPNDTDSIRASVIILSSLLTCEEKEEFRNHRGIMKRLHSLYAFLPPNWNLLTHNSEDYFKKLLAYRKDHSDYDFEKLTTHTDSSVGTDKHERGYRALLPMYYSNIVERILPVVDILFLRCFELSVDKTVMETFLKAFAPIYRYHPQPVTFLYKMAYVLDGCVPALKGGTEPSIFTRFVVAVCKKLDDERSPRYPFLTPEFIIHQHNMPTTKICEALVSRIVAATTYIHQPPEFVSRDWRISEFTPAAQALISACLELVCCCSTHDTKEIVDSLVEVSIQRPPKRPYDRLNAVALILTNLPKRFQNIFFQLIANSFDWESLKENSPDYLFSSYNVEVMQYTEDRIMSILALVQAFIQHANADTLALLCTTMDELFAPKVTNETQLIYFLRIMTVYLLKISDRDKTTVMSDSSSQYLQLIISIYEMIPRILKDKTELEYEDMVCDMLYLFKYTVMGYSVNKETEEAIARFPESMQKKLKFLPSQQTSRDITNHHINKSIPHCTLIQLFDNNFQNIRDHHSDILPVAITTLQQAGGQPQQIQQPGVQQAVPNQQPPQAQPVDQPSVQQAPSNQQPTTILQSNPSQQVPLQQVPNQQQQMNINQQAMSMHIPPHMGPISQASMAQPGIPPASYPSQFSGGSMYQSAQAVQGAQVMQNYQHMMGHQPSRHMAPLPHPHQGMPPPYLSHSSAGPGQRLSLPQQLQPGGFDQGHPFGQQQFGGQPASHFGIQGSGMFVGGHPNQVPHQSGQIMPNRPPYMHPTSQHQPGQMPPRM